MGDLDVRNEVSRVRRKDHKTTTKEAARTMKQLKGAEKKMQRDRKYDGREMALTNGILIDPFVKRLRQEYATTSGFAHSK